MADRSRKITEPPLKLDMDFGEALARFAQTKPADVEESIQRAKQKKPPSDRTQGRLQSPKPGDGNEPED